MQHHAFGQAEAARLGAHRQGKQPALRPILTEPSQGIAQQSAFPLRHDQQIGPQIHGLTEEEGRIDILTEDIDIQLPEGVHVGVGGNA